MRSSTLNQTDTEDIDDYLLVPPPNEREVSLLDECDNFVELDEEQNDDSLEI